MPSESVHPDTRSVVMGRVFVSLLFAAPWACAAREEGEAVVVRDSSGVSIVESNTPAWTEGGAWTLSTNPLLDIGVAEGSLEYQFSDIAGALRLDDGAIVVADGGSQEIRFYDRAGRFVHATGRSGEAPGEYRLLTALGRGPGDSLWAYDFGLRRFTVLTAAGQPIRTVSVGGDLSAVNGVGRMPDGSFVVKEGWSFRSGGQPTLGLVRDSVSVVRFAPDGSDRDTVVSLLGREVYLTSENGRAVMNAPLFAHDAVAAVGGTELVVGDEREPAVGFYAVTGALERIFRIAGSDLRLGAGDVQQAIDEVVARTPPTRRANARAYYASMETPPTRPAFGSLLVDRIGNVWLGEYTRAPARPRTWTVLAADGRWLGDVRVPDRLGVLEIGDDWLLGVWRDELDVEHVRLYDLRKSE